jgi:hypothetical protein
MMTCSIRSFTPILAIGALLASISAPTFAAGSAPQPSICNRSCWGARAASGSHSQMGSLTRAIVHHSAGGEYNTTGLEASKADVRGIQNYQMNSNGWSDIGYHFLLDKFGNIFEGRAGSMSTRPRGAHDADNTNSFGWCCMGYYHPSVNNGVTAAMMNKLYDCIAWRMPNGFSAFGSPGGSYGDLGNTVGRIDAHRRVKATACPGDGIYGPYMGSNLNAGTIRTQVQNRINGGGGGAVTITIDNTAGGFAASANWSVATSSTDKFGADYRYRPTAAISDVASWTANITSAGSYDISAWWTQGTNRAASATYHLPDGTTVNVNQQTNGGAWRSLGSKSLGAGAQEVSLSCWTTTGFVVVADAVRFLKP